jgi:hypothetical protein
MGWRFDPWSKKSWALTLISVVFFNQRLLLKRLLKTLGSSWQETERERFPPIQTLKEQKKALSKEKWLTSIDLTSRNFPFQGHPSYSSCESIFHIFPLPSTGTSMGRFHLSSHWFAHISTPFTPCSYIIKVHLLAPCTTSWRWRHQGPPKQWYPTTTLHDATTQKMTWRDNMFKSHAVTWTVSLHII